MKLHVNRYILYYLCLQPIPQVAMLAIAWQKASSCSLLLPAWKSLAIYLMQKCAYLTEAWGPSGGLYCQPKRGTDVSNMEKQVDSITIIISSL